MQRTKQVATTTPCVEALCMSDNHITTRQTAGQLQLYQLPASRAYVSNYRIHIAGKPYVSIQQQPQIFKVWQPQRAARSKRPNTPSEGSKHNGFQTTNQAVLTPKHVSRQDRAHDQEHHPLLHRLQWHGKQDDYHGLEMYKNHAKDSTTEGYMQPDPTTMECGHHGIWPNQSLQSQGNAPIEIEPMIKNTTHSFHRLQWHGKQ